MSFKVTIETFPAPGAITARSARTLSETIAVSIFAVCEGNKQLALCALSNATRILNDNKTEPGAKDDQA